MRFALWVTLEKWHWGGGEFAESKMVWVSNTDWKGHISKTITRVLLEVDVCVFYSEFTSLLFYNWEWQGGKKIDPVNRR